MDNYRPPWLRLLDYAQEAFRDPIRGTDFATGVDMGLAIALRHPEYAAAMRQSAEGGMDIGHPDTANVVDRLVEAVPIGIANGEAPTS